MDKTDYHDEMDAIVNDKQTKEELKRDPTPALQRKLNSTLLTLKKTNAMTANATTDDGVQYHSQRNFMVCRNYTNLVSQCNLFFLSVVLRHAMSKYLTTIVQPLTDKSRRELHSTGDFINTTKTVQIPNNYKLVSFNVKSLFTSIPLQLALQCTETASLQSTDPIPLPTEDIMDLLNLCLTSTYFQ